MSNTVQKEEKSESVDCGNMEDINVRVVTE